MSAARDNGRRCESCQELRTQLQTARLGVECERFRARYVSQELTFQASLRSSFLLQQKSAANRRWAADMRHSRAVQAAREAAAGRLPENANPAPGGATLLVQQSI